jgi:hypothetical protein
MFIECELMLLGFTRNALPQNTINFKPPAAFMGCGKVWSILNFL